MALTAKALQVAVRDDPSEALAGPRFTGRPPAPFSGPEGWMDGLHVFTDEDEADE